MRRIHLPVVVLLWAADLPAATVGSQRAMDEGGRVFRQLLRGPTEFVTEHWYYFVGAVVLVLALRSYLRR